MRQGGTLNRAITAHLKKAREAAAVLASFSRKKKDRALAEIARGLVRNASALLKANARDVNIAESAGLSAALIDRLTLNSRRIQAMADGLKAVAGLKDYVGSVEARWRRPNGLVISKVRVPIGVIAIIYESRPNVTVECAALCLKSGNAVVLRGGSEAIHTNRALGKIILTALKKTGFPDGALYLVQTTDRHVLDIILKARAYLDLIMPRGGEALIKKVAEGSTVPVIKHYKGICHVYVDRAADLAMAQRIVVNAKCQRPGVCNAAETLLVHKAVAPVFIPRILRALEARGVEIRGCARTRKLYPDITSASEQDWYTEYLDLIISVKVVNSLDEAVRHIAKYGSQHSDAIITRNKRAQKEFSSRVDSAAVYINASTRFTDGGEFGFGAEIGISTDKIHARGPMGLYELTSYKYIVLGRGQIRL